jgi:ankyrin repeat protein
MKSIHLFYTTIFALGLSANISTVKAMKNAGDGSLFEYTPALADVDEPFSCSDHKWFTNYIKNMPHPTLNYAIDMVKTEERPTIFDLINACALLDEILTIKGTDHTREPKNYITLLQNSLIENRELVNIRQEYGNNSALHLATTLRLPETVKILILYGADVNAQNSLQQTPLHIAFTNLDRNMLNNTAYNPDIQRTTKFNSEITIISTLFTHPNINKNVCDGTGTTVIKLAENRGFKFAQK